VTSGSRGLQLLLGGLLIFFSISSFASVWIRRSVEQHIYTALRSIAQSQPDRALFEATAAVKSDPSSASASYLLAAILDETGESQKSIAQSEHCLELDSANGDCHLQLAISLAKQGQPARAMKEAQRALELLPESVRAHDVVFTLSRELRRGGEAVATGRDALTVSPFDVDLHYRVGLAAGEIGDFKTAAAQFAYASLLEPNRPEIMEKMHFAVRFATQALDASAQLRAIAAAAPDSPKLLNELAWIFATHPDAALRDGTRAVQLSQRACELSERKQPAFLATAAAAYAEAGRFSEAIPFARDAASLAHANGDVKTARLAENLLTHFQSNQTYREEPR
jgi:tetratricopeptide (TPR) repeat protein